MFAENKAHLKEVQLSGSRPPTVTERILDIHSSLRPAISVYKVAFLQSESASNYHINPSSWLRCKHPTLGTRIARHVPPMKFIGSRALPGMFAAKYLGGTSEESTIL
jgi:hypothetical protein